MQKLVKLIYYVLLAYLLQFMKMEIVKIQKNGNHIIMFLLLPLKIFMIKIKKVELYFLKVMIVEMDICYQWRETHLHGVKQKENL